VKVSVKPTAVYATLEDGAVILNPDSGLYYSLDSVGARIWELVGSGTTRTELVDSLHAEYDVARDVLDSDVHALLQTLETNGLVELAAA
jgi:hypothetical protein